MTVYTQLFTSEQKGQLSFVLEGQIGDLKGPGKESNKPFVTKTYFMFYFNLLIEISSKYFSTTSLGFPKTIAIFRNQLK